MTSQTCTLQICKKVCTTDGKTDGRKDRQTHLKDASHIKKLLVGGANKLKAGPDWPFDPLGSAPCFAKKLEKFPRLHPLASLFALLDCPPTNSSWLHLAGSDLKPIVFHSLPQNRCNKTSWLCARRNFLSNCGSIKYIFPLRPLKSSEIPLFERLRGGGHLRF